MTAKPISIKLTGGKSGGCASKAVELTSGDQAACHESVTEGEAIHSDRAAEVASRPEILDWPPGWLAQLTGCVQGPIRIAQYFTGE
jgi:hypothetical protein